MRVLVALLVVLASHIALAQPAKTQLKIDACTGGEDTPLLRQQGAEHYVRGETLFLQGDYRGAIGELEASYCKVPKISYSILKDIAQAYERSLDYEHAVAYFERFLKEMPPDAQRASNCAPDPKDERTQIKLRIAVLKALPAHVLIQTQPGNATIQIERRSDQQVVKRGTSGDNFELAAGDYTMRVSLRGHQEHEEPFTTKIGTPDTKYVELVPQTGKISVQTTPGDAKIYVDDGRGEHYVNQGSWESTVDAKRYHVRAERPGRQVVERDVEVVADQLTQVGLDLPPVKQFGRRQLIVGSTIAGSIATGGLLNAFGQTSIATAGSIGGGGAALVFSYLYLPERVPLGTSNLTITTTASGAVVGFAGSLLFTKNDNIIAPVTGASMILAGATGYYIGERTKIKPGDAALINSAALWGTTAGLLFASSFDPDRRVGGGLVLSGFAMGAISGSVMTRYFDISRTHAALIDVGGVIGILGGLATEGLVYGTRRAATDTGFTDAEREHIANYTLGGMAVGLIAAGILTRNIDAPKFAAKPTVRAAVTANGSTTPTLGFEGAW